VKQPIEQDPLARPVTSGNVEGQDDGMNLDIMPILRICWKKRRVFFSILTVGITLCLIYLLSLPPYFTSTSTLLPPENSSPSSNLMSLFATGGLASAGSAALGLKSPGAIYVAILGSRTIQERLVKRYNLLEEYHTPSHEIACIRLAGSSNISDNIKNGLITISVKARNPHLAANLAQGYSEELNLFLESNSTSAAHRERVFLEERLKEIKKDLDDSSIALSQFSTKSRTLDIQTQGKSMVESGIKLQDQMTLLRAELAALRQSYSEDNVRVRAAKARIAELQHQIDKVMGSPDDSTNLDKDLGFPTVSQLPTLGLTSMDLQRKARVEEALWEALTKQYEMAKVQEAREIPTVRVLDPANVPERKTPGGRLLKLILGSLASLLLATLAVYAINFWEEMDEADQRKKIVTSIARPVLRPLQWISNWSWAPWSRNPMEPGA